MPRDEVKFFDSETDRLLFNSNYGITKVNAVMIM